LGISWCGATFADTGKRVLSAWMSPRLVGRSKLLDYLRLSDLYTTFWPLSVPNGI